MGRVWGTGGVDEDVPVDFVAPQDVVGEGHHLGPLGLADGAGLPQPLAQGHYREGLAEKLEETVGLHLVQTVAYGNAGGQVRLVTGGGGQERKRRKSEGVC
jgi:hypothetical protein